MFSYYVAAIGLCLGFRFRWFALLIVGSIIAIALGVEGALHGRPFGAIALSVVGMLIVLELAYFLAASGQAFGLRHWRYRQR